MEENNMNNPIKTAVSSAQKISEDIKPSVKTDVSPQTVSFFEDFADRYKMFNNRDRRDKIIKRIKNNRSRTVSDELLKKKKAGAFYHPATHTVNIPEDVSFDTYTHELTHSLNDSFFGSLPRSRKEKRLLRKAYKIHSNPFYKLINGKNEWFTTNTALRRNISHNHDNVLGNELNNVIQNISDDDLLTRLGFTQGYLDINDYYKPIASSAKELYNKVPGANVDLDTGETTAWEDLSRKERRDWRRAFRKNAFASTASNREIDYDKLNAVREALIHVAKQGGKL